MPRKSSEPFRRGASKGIFQVIRKNKKVLSVKITENEIKVQEECNSVIILDSQIKDLTREAFFEIYSLLKRFFVARFLNISEFDLSDINDDEFERAKFEFFNFFSEDWLGEDNENN